MKFINQNRMYGRLYREKAGEGGEGGGGEGEGGGSDDATAELTAQLEAMQTENSRLQAKISEANKHAKQAERAATEEARKKAEAEGNFEQLFKSSESERENLSTQLQQLQGMVASEKVGTEAMRLATSMADGANAELLSEFIARRLKYTDEGIKITDESGNLTVSTLDDLKREFAGSARFASLLKGNQSSGGGASGGANGGGATAKTITRAEFDALDPMKRAKHFKDGGKIIDQ